MPSDFRPPHLFGSKEAAEAAGAAERLEAESLPPDVDLDRDVDWEVTYDEDADELARLKYKQAMRRLLQAFPELDPCPHPCPRVPVCHEAVPVWSRCPRKVAMGGAAGPPGLL